MANPSTLIGSGCKPAVLVASSTAAVIMLDGDRHYDCAHDGEDTSASPSVVTIYLATDAAVDADASEGADKAKLLSGRSIRIGPGVSQLKFYAASSTTFTVVPSARYGGHR